MLSACKSSEEFSGFSYDPPDVTDTSDKIIRSQKVRVVGVDSPKVWISNEFKGARFNDFFMGPDSVYQVVIEPENAPINNSPWFAFSIWSEEPGVIPLRITYKEGRHRYRPKTIREVNQGRLPYAFLPAEEDSAGNVLVYVPVNRDRRIVSAQPLHSSDMLADELSKRGISDQPFVSMDTVGYSEQGRPITELTITENQENREKRPVLVILSRQHPPEVTGYLGALSALEALTSNDSLAQAFRNTFVIKAYPMVNPDGVDNGHWRHNANGVDLNRDWKNFNQPETRVIRDAITSFMEGEDLRMVYAIDYHSTDENIFYPILSEIETSPDNITQEWVESIGSRYPGYSYRSEEFDTSSPISKNWFYRTYGIDALTYEIDDRMPEVTLQEVSKGAMYLLMDLLLKKWTIIDPD